MNELFLLAFGQTVRNLRLSQGLSQEDLAEKAGLHRTYIGGIERGERNLSLLNILKIAQSLSIPLSTLFLVVEESDDFPL